MNEPLSSFKSPRFSQPPTFMRLPYTTDLAGVGGRASTRIAGLSDVEYFAQSLYEPDAFIVEGFNPGEVGRLRGSTT